MTYEHDIFLSYPTAPPVGEWVGNTFLPMLRQHLIHSMLEEPTIFIDRDGIHPGDNWPDRIKYALAHSKIMVAIFSTAYFRSTWCNNEMAVMRYRENQHGFRTIANPAGIVLPIKVFDGQHYPPFAREMQHWDCSSYLRTGEGFRASSRHLQFQDEFETWGNQVVSAIESAPEWDDAWLSPEWIEEPIAEIAISPEPEIELPSIDIN